MEEIVLHVNGSDHTLRVDPDTPLLYVLRNDLGLKAAKFGCGTGQCGACTVLIDGQPRPSCRLSVSAVVDRQITTLEGLSREGILDPVQQAFVDEGAVQCGFCTPGMILVARALLDRYPEPTDEQIRSALSACLCRCGVYDRARRAVYRASGRDLDPSREILVDPAVDPSPASVALPAPLVNAPELDRWIGVNADGTITVMTGKVEIGQDLRTSIAMIAAEELDVALRRVSVKMADTDVTADESYTGSSMSLETSGEAVRHAAAEARHIMLCEAAEELSAPIERLIVRDGTISDPRTGQSTDYWTLHGGRRFGAVVSGRIWPKGRLGYGIVGTGQSRGDLVEKVTGKHRFVHDLDMPGMLHGRVVRPPSYGARLADVDEESVRRMPGVIAVVRDGSFLGVVAQREEQAVSAMKALEADATWRPGEELLAQERLAEYMLGQPEYRYLIIDGTPTDDDIPEPLTPPGAAHTLSATYFRPYHAHASLGPSSAIAQMIDGKLTVWTHSQGVYPVRDGIAYTLNMAKEDVRLIHVESSGSFGHNGADDVALDAALLARALPGSPISLSWTRAQENAWEPYGPAAVIQMRGSLDAQGDVIAWNHDVYGYAHGMRPRPYDGVVALSSSWHLYEPFAAPQAQPSLGPQTGIHRNADPLYTFPSRRIVGHFLYDSPLHTSALRGLGSYANVFAVESFVDEMAWAAGEDPVAFRLRYLTDERAIALISALAHKAAWQPGPRPRGDGHGRGLAFAQYKNRQVYVAAVVDVRVERETGRIHLERALVGAEAGQAINPESLSAQIEGGMIQSASWTLCEEVTFDRQRVTSTDWMRYPILRAREAPTIETLVISRPGLPLVGVGEGVMGPAPAAIANAVFDAVGVRLRTVPFRPERVLAALRQHPV